MALSVWSNLRIFYGANRLFLGQLFHQTLAVHGPRSYSIPATTRVAMSSEPGIHLRNSNS